MRNERSVDCDRSAVTLCGLGFETGLTAHRCLYMIVSVVEVKLRAFSAPTLCPAKSKK
jgi:hypothetical protein